MLFLLKSMDIWNAEMVATAYFKNMSAADIFRNLLTEI